MAPAKSVRLLITLFIQADLYCIVILWQQLLLSIRVSTATSHVRYATLKFPRSVACERRRKYTCNVPDNICGTLLQGVGGASLYSLFIR